MPFVFVCGGAFLYGSNLINWFLWMSFPISGSGVTLGLMEQWVTSLFPCVCVCLFAMTVSPANLFPPSRGPVRWTLGLMWTWHTGTRWTTPAWDSASSSTTRILTEAQVGSCLCSYSFFLSLFSLPWPARFYFQLLLWLWKNVGFVICLCWLC